jgi:alpha-glucosidase
MCVMTEWWRTAVVYQIYIRSFADANGDGIGDIAGVRSRLWYLSELGVDAIWINPWYPSPMVDGGYDVADYRSIDPLFGSLDDARGLIADAHAAGLRVMIDVVPNHSSAEHPWFREAWSAARGSAARRRYLFRDGRGPGGDEPPNNWRDIFGGSAWAMAPDDGLEPRQWYLHLFDESQPDFNWDDPEVRADFEETLRFWLALGVDGFRIDVASFLLKAPGLPDIPGAPAATSAASFSSAWDPTLHPYENQPGLHEIYRRWRAIANRADREAAFCGEIHLPLAEIAAYLRPDELQTAFNFDFALRPWDAGALRRSIDATLATHAAVGAPATWVIGNHDLPRPAYRYGRDGSSGRPWNGWERLEPSDGSTGLARARAMALAYLALPGSAYVYQGDELGLPEVLDLPAQVREDPTFARSGGADVGRDGGRIPLPWEGQAPPYGFGPPGSRPWLPQPADWSETSVAAESADSGSTLELYRGALRLRRSHPGFDATSFRWLPSPDETLAFGRAGGFVCAVNLSPKPMALPEGATVLLSSAPMADGSLAQDSAAWLEIPTESTMEDRWPS